MKKRTEEEVAIFVAVYFKRTNKTRGTVTRKALRQLAGRAAAPVKWYNNICEEIAEYGICMFPVSETHFALIEKAKTKSWPKGGVVKALGDDFINPDFDKLRAEVEIPQEEDNDE